jgi:hypothetical protein
MFGYAVGDKAAHKGGSTGYKGERLHNPEKNFQPIKFGNELATNVGKGGPGTGRTLYGQSGQQGCHGPTRWLTTCARSRDLNQRMNRSSSCTGTL